MKSVSLPLTCNSSTLKSTPIVILYVLKINGRYHPDNSYLLCLYHNKGDVISYPLKGNESFSLIPSFDDSGNKNIIVSNKGQAWTYATHTGKSNEL